MFRQLFQLYYLKDLGKLDNYTAIYMASTHDYIKDIRNENIKIYRAGSQDGFSWTLKKETALEFQQRYNNIYNPI